GTPFALSEETEFCSGIESTTTTGLFDVNGDGKPDVLGSDGTVYELVSDGRIGAPQSGRLVQVDNGFGANTVITYASTKLLASSGAANTLHQLPFSEVVVTSVQTTVPQHPELNLAPTLYAYGGAQQIFDPVADRFAFRGYRRQVALRTPTSEASGLATITDLYQPDIAADPYDLGTAPRTNAERYARYLRMGRVSDVSVLQVDAGTNPSALLSANVATDSRRIGNTHYEYDARSLDTSSDPPGPEPCLEMVYPYNQAASQAFNTVDACRARGFAFATSVESSHGAPGAALRSASTVTTRVETRSVDDFGRPLTIANLGDFARGEDDVCIVTMYATPKGSDERVLSAVASRTVTDCVTDTIYSKQTFEYDTLQAGSVSSGFLTSRSVERRDDTGHPLGTIREFDATYDDAGNPHTMTTSREDGASRSATVDYDSFGLAPVKVTSEASNVPTIQISITRDPLTLLVTGVTDPNGTQRGKHFDGFNRPTMLTVTLSGGVPGALSVTSYQGFGDGDVGGRRITEKIFTDAVDPATTDTAVGRTATMHIDELGRRMFTIVTLGADYPDETIVAGARTYDSLGRVRFQADPFPSTQDGATAFGTTHHFNTSGTPSCNVRGNGVQPFTTVTDEAHEIYPTCFFQTFQDNLEWVNVRDSASLLAQSPQNGVVKGTAFTAAGWLVTRSSWRSSTRFEHAVFGHDRLGHVTS
ncbi:MAG: toxin TcdB middle/N-terminal domain-containing protein, partial [bacterium]